MMNQEKLADVYIETLLKILEEELEKENLTQETWDHSYEIETSEAYIFEQFENGDFSSEVDVNPVFTGDSEDKNVAKEYEEVLDKLHQRLERARTTEDYDLADLLINAVSGGNLDYDTYNDPCIIEALEKNLPLFAVTSYTDVGQLFRPAEQGELFVSVYQRPREIEIESYVHPPEFEGSIDFALSKTGKTLNRQGVPTENLDDLEGDPDFQTRLEEEIDILLSDLGVLGLDVLIGNNWGGGISSSVSGNASMSTFIQPAIILNLSEALVLLKSTLRDASRLLKEKEKAAKKAAQAREVVYTYRGGGSEVFDFARVVGEEDFKQQGIALGQCLGSHHAYLNATERGEAELYSMQTPSGKIKFSFYWEPVVEDDGTTSIKYSEVLGKANRQPEKPLEIKALAAFVENYLKLDPRDFRDIAQGLPRVRRQNPSRPSRRAPRRREGIGHARMREAGLL